MIIYLDLLFFLNMWIDFLLIISCNIILKYSSSYLKIFFGSFIGALSTFLVFIKSDIVLIALKVIVCFLIQIVVNGFKGIKTTFENVIYFYFVNVILAGVLYLFKIERLNIWQNYIILVICTPLILLLYNSKIKKLNTYYCEVYDVIVIYNNKKYSFNAYLDTGNKLYDPYKRRPISIIYTKKIKYDYENGILVPVETANGISMMKCIKAEKIIVNGKEIKNAIIGLSSKKINIQDIDMILHKDMI